MAATFDYLLDKIAQTGFEETPFHHLEISSFLSEEHFQEITQSPEIRLDKAATDKGLCDSLLANGYAPIKFPGCTTSIDRYLKWRQGRAEHVNVDTCEGFGIAFRLEQTTTPLIEELKDFLTSDAFVQTIAKKFEIDRSIVFADTGIQKYLDGYEISPHPDIRKKALTFMVNINPLTESERLNHHTHYLVFKKSKRYVQEFWHHNPQYERSWVPWDWCESVKQQTRNNSIVVFSPSHDTMHAVRADYDHLATQRTQLYGNLWYGERKTKDVRDAPYVELPAIPWQGLLIDESRGTRQVVTGGDKGVTLLAKRAAKFLLGK